eukprot:181613_1
MRNGYRLLRNAFRSAKEFEQIVCSELSEISNSNNIISYNTVGGAVERSYIDNSNIVNVGKASPSFIAIPFHHEMGYNQTFVPHYISFGCFESASNGGITRISNSIKFSESLPTILRNKFEKYGVMYSRNLFDKNLSLNEILSKTKMPPYRYWQDFFNQNELQKIILDKNTEIIEYNKINNIATYKYIGNPWIIHPNKNISKNPILAQSLLIQNGRHFDCFQEYNKFTLNQRPTHTKWGNDEEINQHEYDLMSEIYNQYAIDIELEKGDIIIIDNLLWAHGRTSFVDDPNNKRLIGAVLFDKVERPKKEYKFS